MIAKITRGERPGDIAAYLHGPGKANEHMYRIGNTVHTGGRVIGGNLGREGNIDGRRWGGDLRVAAHTRVDIKNPIWHVSLRNDPDDRHLTDQEWADAGQTFAEHMGYADHPWVMVRHGDDHVHIVTSRVSERGDVWHARNDRRAAQRAAAALERDYGLIPAPRVKTTSQRAMPQKEVNQRHREQQSILADMRQLKKIQGALAAPKIGAATRRGAQGAIEAPVRPHREAKQKVQGQDVER